MKYYQLIAGICLITGSFTACKTSKMAAVPKSFPQFYKEGHRGTRGLMPENTIPAMIKGIETGANVIEVDVYTSKDGQVIIAHDPYINIEHSYFSDGTEIPKEDAKKYVLHHMNYEDIKKFDVGSKPFPKYPQQKRIAAYIPLLGELIDSVEAYTTAKNLPKTIYNIELKNMPEYDVVLNATPPVLVDAVMEVVKSKNIGDRYYIQSFDFRPLQYAHKKYPKLPLGFLTNSKLTFEENIAKLGFTPQIYSPHYSLITPELIAKCKKLKIKFVPWTVNTVENMKKFIDLGVDGIITDYPNYFEQVNK